ncbi:MAG: sigma-70 family RNA polymerase sigma factor [Clostridia bacterium]|nr:sigma-70 family RNA polymerase sigma factor [Clostridia bacterium]MBR3680680.1 sigma-70 family RNA polymerase sigma factor [Clostridia bacterium]
MNELSETKNSYDRNPELIMRFREGDEEAGAALVELNLPLVYSIASRFYDRGRDPEELVECGTVGLCKAIKTFDPARGCAFSTYAVPLIFGEIRRFLRDDGMIKVSREEKRLSAILNRERERRAQAGEPTDLASIAATVGIPITDAASAIFSEVPVKSLEEGIAGEDEGLTLGSVIADEEAERGFDRIALFMAIEGLSPLHRRIVFLRYFRDLSQTETASILGITQVKVSREEKKIMEQLRRLLC